MPQVTCPKCQERYDPGVDDDLRDMPENMSLKVVCPKCGQWVRLPENEPIDAPDLPATIADDLKAQSQPMARPEEPRERAWGEEDDRPRRRRRRDEHDEGDRDREFDRHRPWVDQAAEDYSDAPGGRSRPLDSLGLASMIVGILSCIISLTGCCCPLFDLVSLAGGIAAVIMGFLARRRPTASGMALAGLITGFISIGVSLVIIGINVVGVILRM